MSYEVAACASVVAWAVYVVVLARMFFTRERAERWRDRSLMLGLALQIMACWVTPLSYRPNGAPLVPSEWAQGAVLEQITRFTAVIIQIGSVWMTYSAIRTLGKQWALSARLVEGHELIRTGPYGLVRHPIYTALMGMTIGCQLTVCTWQGVLVGALLTSLGSLIRVRSEERLMRDTFGADYASYARSVPALVPWLRLPRARTTGT